MGALNTTQANWPDVIMTVRCDRQRVCENLLSSEACWDWVPEIKEVHPKRDGDVAPGMLCKTDFSNATVYIKIHQAQTDEKGVGTYVEWTFYACGWGPKIEDNTHVWIKENYDFKFNQHIFLSDCPGHPGASGMLRATPDEERRPGAVRLEPAPRIMLS